MSKSYSVPCQILDKRIKEGWFGRRKFYITVRLLTMQENENSPIEWLSSFVKEYEAKMEDYYAAVIGDEKDMILYVHSNGKGYPYPERK